MEKYTLIVPFMKAVTDKDEFALKVEIINMFIIFKGSKEKINAAINYAIQNKALVYADHIPTVTDMELDSNLDKYTHESAELMNNFSNTRVADVFKYYDLSYGEKYKVHADKKAGSANVAQVKTGVTLKESKDVELGSTITKRNYVKYIVIALFIYLVLKLIKNIF